MVSRTLLKIIETDDTKELETLTNDFVKKSGEVYAVVNMRVYPCDNGKWVNYIIYKEMFKDGGTIQ